MELLQVSKVRNLTAVTITPGPNLNVLGGPNASGKTATLESICLLARARSFRTARIQDVIQHGSQVLRDRGEILKEKQGKISAGTEKRVGESKIRYNGETVKSVSEQARNTPWFY